MQAITDHEAQTIARHYLIAAIWADAEEGTSPGITRQAQAAAEQLAREFVARIGLQLFRATLDAYTAAGLRPDCEGEPCAAFGHDLYLTLEGHGVGFWDRDALNVCYDNNVLSLGELLSAACEGNPWECAHSYGLLEFYRGWVYLRAPSKA